MRMIAAFQQTRRAPLLQVVKSAAATVIAWLVAGWLIPGELPVFAAIAAVLVVQPSINQSFARAMERSVGVVLGVGIALGLGLLFGSQSFVILLAVLVSLLIAWTFRATAATANQVAISAMLVLALGSSSTSYAVERIVETIIGAVIGIIINAIIVPPILIAPVRRDIGLLTAEVAASLERLADALGSACTPAQRTELLIMARLLRPMLESARESLAIGEESLSLNPRRSAHRDELSRHRLLLDQALAPIVIQVLGMTRAFSDHYDHDLHRDPAALAIAEQLRRAGHDVRLAGQKPEMGVESTPSVAVPALTAPLILARPSPRYWILIGSLMEDLRRIHSELGNEDIVGLP